MDSSTVREKFLKYFEGVGHRRVKSSSLVPAQDPTLLFTNAGMVQFKDCFLGLHDPGYRRATTAQKCVRAGGKHNDLENVGITPRHHTFFEMLGNFSFGDYFKKDAIAFSWELLTKHYQIPKDRLRITVFETDDEAFELWKAQGVRADWIVRLGEKDNFWSMGDTGPCGPCTEIHFDWGVNRGCGKPTCAPGCPCDTRFLEIWNLVFMQFNRDISGKLTNLPKPSVDTGAGLERLSAVLQGVYSNYDSDLFQPILNSIGQKVGMSYGNAKEMDVSMRVIADHLRSGTFLIADGVIPSNEGRGYVLRRILRRAIRHGKKLNQDSPFLHTLVGEVTQTLGGVYPEILEKAGMIKSLVAEEEEKFHLTLHRGLGLLEESIGKLKTGSKILSGDIVFKLYDTFGFPLDLIQVICAEQNVQVDTLGFNVLMEKQKSQSTWTGSRSDSAIQNILKSFEAKNVTSTFVGYDHLNASGRVLNLWNERGEPVQKMKSSGFAVMDKTPFYAESGGQVGDKGSLKAGVLFARVEDTKKIGGVIVHFITVESGELHVNDAVEMKVDMHLRQQTAINHTATHILHAALRKVLGERVKQAGSLVEPTRLRFDFAYPRAVAIEELKKVETIVNHQIWSGASVTTTEMKYDDAVKCGALAFFEDKYGDDVRVVKVGSEVAFSVELCGGTHLKNTSEIGLLKVISESSVASGVRRIEAVTSDSAWLRMEELESVLEKAAEALGVKPSELLAKIEGLTSEAKSLRKEISGLQLKAAQGGSGAAPWDKKSVIRDLQVVIENIPGSNANVLRTLCDQIRDKLKNKVVVVLASEVDGKVALCLGISQDLVGRLNAGKMIKGLASDLGGTGGGRPDFAQAGGTNPSGIASAFEKFRAELTKRDLN